MNLDFYLTPHTKFNSKWIIGLLAKAKTIKLLEENAEINLPDLGVGNGFLDITGKNTSNKKIQLDKLDFVKIKNICASKNTIKNALITNHRIVGNTCNTI